METAPAPAPTVEDPTIYENAKKVLDLLGWVKKDESKVEGLKADIVKYEGLEMPEMVAVLSGKLASLLKSEGSKFTDDQVIAILTEAADIVKPATKKGKKKEGDGKPKVFRSDMDKEKQVAAVKGAIHALSHNGTGKPVVTKAILAEVAKAIPAYSASNINNDINTLLKNGDIEQVPVTPELIKKWDLFHKTKFSLTTAKAKATKK